MHKIKQTPQDFIVKEINNLSFNDNGEYSYYILKKTNYNTVDAIRKISESFRIDEKYINYAGTKDRVAITEQYISISRGPIKDLSLKDIELKYVGKGLERLNLGSLQGNYFEIIVRDIDSKPDKKELFLNFFDDQRFGRNLDNHIVGKLILKGEYKKACDLIPETQNILINTPNNFVGALRSIPKKILKMYIHAYQSYLWNIAALELSKTIKENIKLDIIGFGTKFKDENIKNVYQKIMIDDNINFREFINRSIPELSEEGTTRDMYIKVNDLIISDLEDDDLNENKKKVLIKFSLPPGAYATNVIKELFKEN